MRRRGKRFSGGGAKVDRHRASGFGRHLQPAQPRVVLHLLEPQEHCAACARFERLLRSPHRILAIGGPHDEAALERNARLRDRRRIRQVRRVHPGDHVAAFGRAREGTRKQAHFPDADAVMQHFGERAHRPSSAGKLAIQGAMAGRYRRMDDVLELAAAPDAGKLRERRDAGFHETPRERLRITPTATPSMASVSRGMSRCSVLKSGLAGMSSAFCPRTLSRFTVTSSPTRATTIWPFFAYVVRWTTSQSPSRMPSSRMLKPRTCSR